MGDLPGTAEPSNASILHVDMDAFYASVEALDDPALAGRPLIVGGAGARGVVASCSYEARAYGVRSAMPSSRARRLCPQAVFVSGRYDRYHEVSRQIHDIFVSFTPLVEGISLDEAFLDVTGSVRLFGPPVSIAHAVRNRVREELGLGCSVGLAPVKFLAKLASEAAKPAASLKGVVPGKGVFVVEPGQELAFLHPLPIEALWGVGPATAARLRRLGVTKVGDLAALPAETVESAVGRAHGTHLFLLAHGIDERRVEPEREVKSISHEETYAVDRDDRDGLHAEIVRMSDAVAGRMRKAGLSGRTVSIKVRYGDFRTLTRSHTAPRPVFDGQAMAAIAASMLDALDLGDGIRLLGVGVSGLTGSGQDPASGQLVLDLEGTGGGEGDGDPAGPSWREATEAVDAVRERFGHAAVGPAALVGPGGIRVKRQGDTQWGPSS
ncbi:MAG TPA: DNA polymerase IV [Acidimicrobiales bacterium]|nr:DNA polymerase IV [Acidimicrobiales bacterium]